MTDLQTRVADYVREHPGETLDDIARGVRARTADVRDVLLGGGFQATQRAAYPSDRALVYHPAPPPQDGPGRARRPSQCDRVAAVLRDGRWHTAAEIHDRCGTMRLNSRINDLRSKHGMLIASERVAGVENGPEAYRYRLVGTSEETAREDARVPAMSGHPAVSSDVSALGTAESPGAEELGASVQLEIGAAA